MNNICYGVAGRDGGFIELYGTERGAKRKASNNGYTELYAMDRVSWAVWQVAQYNSKSRRWECVQC